MFSVIFLTSPSMNFIVKLLGSLENDSGRSVIKFSFMSRISRNLRLPISSGRDWIILEER